MRRSRAWPRSTDYDRPGSEAWLRQVPRGAATYSDPTHHGPRTAAGLLVCTSHPGSRAAGGRGTAWAAEWDRSLPPCVSHQSDGLTFRFRNGNMMLMGRPVSKHLDNSPHDHTQVAAAGPSREEPRGRQTPRRADRTTYRPAERVPQRTPRRGETDRGGLRAPFSCPAW